MAMTPRTPGDSFGKGRIEAFSDGVFAIAITLLVLDLKSPKVEGNRALLSALGAAWPVYLAYATSFTTVLIMWINHHLIFRCLRRVDHTVLLLNGLLLLCVTVVPYPTSLLAEYLLHPGGTTAAAVFAGMFVLTAVAFNLLWRYSSWHGRLLEPQLSPAFLRRFTMQYNAGVPLYLLAVGLAFVHVVTSLLLCLALAVLFALPTPIRFMDIGDTGDTGATEPEA